MLVLAVDTSTKAGSVAVLRDGRLLGVRSSSATEPHASGLFTDLDRLLDELHIPMTAFELFAVAAGPGSFTGLRIGLTAAKAWAEAFARPIAAVSSLEAIAVQAQGLPDFIAGSRVAAVQDARRGQVFGQLYDHRVVSRAEDVSCVEFVPLGEDLLLPASEFVNLVATRTADASPRGLIFVSPVSEPIRSALAASTLSAARLEVVSGVLAPFIGQIGHARALRGEVVDALHLDANYVRRTDAEVKWKDGSPA